jgi:hypothetical protein
MNFDVLLPRISRNIGVTLGIGDYEFVKVQVGMDIDVPAGMTITEAQEALEDRLLEELDRTINVVLDNFNMEEDINVSRGNAQEDRGN